MLCVFVDVRDSHYAYAPDSVRSIRIKAPDGSIFYLDLSLDYLPWDRAFYKSYYPSDFDGGVIPTGWYGAKVKTRSGTNIVQKDYVVDTFLPIPNVTYPTPGLTGVPQSPVITWDPVPGATVYEIRLFNESWRDWVYYYPSNRKWTHYTSHEIPPGMLKPNCDYTIRIEARYLSPDFDMRSRSDWINFQTGSW